MATLLWANKTHGSVVYLREMRMSLEQADSPLKRAAKRKRRLTRPHHATSHNMYTQYATHWGTRGAHVLSGVSRWWDFQTLTFIGIADYVVYWKIRTRSIVIICGRTLRITRDDFDGKPLSLSLSRSRGNIRESNCERNTTKHTNFLNACTAATPSPPTQTSSIKQR